MAGAARHRLARIALVLACASGLGALARGQGKLDEVREAVRDDDRGDEEEDDADDADEDECDDQLEAEIFASAAEGGDVFDALLAPFLFPRQALGDDGGPARFAEYPYRDGAGYFRLPDEVPCERRISARPRVELGRDFDDLERLGLGLQLEHASRFGLDVAWSRWREDLAGPGEDELDLADLNATYRFAQSDHVAFRAGLGLNYLNDELDEDLGVNGTYAVEFLPARPWLAALEGDLGTLGDATLTHLRLELGYAIERFELFTSYDRWELDDAELWTLALGLRGWL